MANLPSNQCRARIDKRGLTTTNLPPDPESMIREIETFLKGALDDPNRPRLCQQLKAIATSQPTPQGWSEWREQVNGNECHRGTENLMKKQFSNRKRMIEELEKFLNRYLDDPTVGWPRLGQRFDAIARQKRRKRSLAHRSFTSRHQMARTESAFSPNFGEGVRTHAVCQSR